MRIDRMIGILSILLQKDRVTAPQLAETFEVSRRTIIRDIDALCRAGIPIRTAQGKHGGIAIMDAYRMDRTLLTRSDVQALLAGLRSLDSVSGTNRYGQLMEKISPGASSLLPGDSRILIDLSSWYKSTLAPKIEQIHAAADRHRLIFFHYLSPAGESDRTVEPYFLLFHWASWYVWGYCRTRLDFRLFKLNRMTGLTVGDAFEPRPCEAPDLSDQRVFPARYPVRMRLPVQYKWRLIEEYGEQCFTQTPDGNCLFSAGFTDREQVLSWVLSFQGEAELLEPAELRADLAAIGEKITRRHQT